jgi:hypothetical protein
LAREKGYLRYAVSVRLVRDPPEWRVVGFRDEFTARVPFDGRIGDTSHTFGRVACHHMRTHR